MLGGAMRQFISAVFGLVLALTLNTARAVENVWDYAVQVSAQVQTSPAQITLSWPQDTQSAPSSYTVYRKAPKDSSWGSSVASLSGSTLSWTDSNVSVGSVYEYRVTKNGGTATSSGYVEAGLHAPLVDTRGKVVLLVDNT